MRLGRIFLKLAGLMLLIILVDLIKNIIAEYPFADFSLSLIERRYNREQLVKFQNSELLKSNIIEGEISAAENNLGIIAVRFANPYGGANTDILIFRIKEKGEDSWYYENKYITDQFLPNELFPFGFPKISQSKGKLFRFQIESTEGKPGNAVSISLIEPVIAARYKYDKNEILKNPAELAMFSLRKLSRYFNLTDAIFLVGAFVCLFIVRGFSKKYRQLQLSKTHKTADILISAALLIFILAVTIPFSRLGVDAHHDGIMFKPALDVARGMTVFNQTYTQYGAVTVFLQAIALKLFGNYLLVLRVLTAFFYALTGLFLYLSLKKLLPDAMSVVTVLLWVFTAPFYSGHFLPWSSSYALLFQVISLYLLLKFGEKKKPLYLFLSGVTASLTFWTRQPVGIFLISAIFLFFIIKAFFRRYNIKKSLISILIVTAGILAVTSLILFYLSVKGALQDFWMQSIYLSFLFGEKYGSGYAVATVLKSLFPVKYEFFWLVLPVLNLLIFVAAFLLMIRKGKTNRENDGFLLFSLIALFSWLQYFPISEYWHFFFASLPMTGLLVVGIWRVNVKLGHYRMLFVTVILYILFAPVVEKRLAGIRAVLDSDYKVISYPDVLRGLKVNETDEKYLFRLGKEMDRFFGENPKSNLVSATEDSLYLTFWQGQQNFYKIYTDLPKVGNISYFDYQSKLTEYIKTEKPLIIANSYDLFEGFCQIYLDSYSRGVVLKKPFTGSKRVEANVYQKEGSDYLYLKIEEINRVKDIVMESYDNFQKRRLYRIGGKSILTEFADGGSIIENDYNSSKIVSVKLPSETRPQDRVVVKVLFEGEDCYYEIEARNTQLMI